PNPSSGELPDPIFGIHKALVICYSTNGKVGLWVRRDDRTVILPEALSPQTGAELTLDDLDYLLALTEQVKDGDVADLAKLETLDLAGKFIDGAGLVHLRGLKNLKSLSLNGTQIDDAGLRSLSGLIRLTSLNLSNTPIADAATPSIANLVELKELWL